jgi:hypothetical protein
LTPSFALFLFRPAAVLTSELALDFVPVLDGTLDADLADFVPDLVTDLPGAPVADLAPGFVADLALAPRPSPPAFAAVDRAAPDLASGQRAVRR